ncbi:MAG TPA: NAD(P)H-hydrate dehydratase [Methanoregulaceae archaeon]|nr:NAD(P)H-hydrate dehydratase [Methanoregulaceae archaeon]
MDKENRQGLFRVMESGPVSQMRMKIIETNAVALGLPEACMMESAGRALAGFVGEKSPSCVTVLCGKGNNGGDGMVAARYLAKCTRVEVWYLEDREPSKAREEQKNLLSHCDLPMYPFRCARDLAQLEQRLDGCDIIVDALLGTGGSPPLRDPLDECVRIANNSGVPVVSADVPTPGLTPRWICAFHRPKVTGSEVLDIGIPVEAEVYTGPGEVLLVPRKATTAHKGAGGRVLVIGGGPYQGAPYLAGLGALRAGADIVRIASPVFEPVPDLIYEPLGGVKIDEGHIPRLIGLVKDADVVVCGNGLGDASHHVVSAIAPHCRKAVFDADALRTPLPVSEKTIYTPHAGEFTRISGKKLPDDLLGRAETIRQFADGRTVLLKGAIDIISDGSRVRFNRTGTPSMTVGGTGDVLAGVTAALFCHLDAFDAAVIAAYVNGKAGMNAETVLGGGLLASDIVNYIPGVLSGRSTGQ